MADSSVSQCSSGRRPFADLSVLHRFTLIYWDKVSLLFMVTVRADEPARIICIQDCPDWPNWRLSTSPQALGDNLVEVEAYSQSYHVWMNVELAYTHVLKSDCHIFLRRRGVNCLDEQEQLSRFLFTALIQHFCYNMPLQCYSVLGKRCV